MEAKRRRLVLAVVALVAAGGVERRAWAQAPSPQQEQAMIDKALQQDDEAYFGGCDGYGASRKSGDGMTAVAIEAFGIHPMLEAKSGDTVRRTPEFGMQGIANCGAALADLQRYPQFWMRKVSLLRARALHRFAVGDTAGAEADLASAEAAAAPSDAWYARSLKPALALQRAYFLSRTGLQEDADRLAMAAWNERPFSRQATYAAVVAIGANGAAGDLQRLGERLKALDPDGHVPPSFLLPRAPSDAALPSTPSPGQDLRAFFNVLPEPETAPRAATYRDGRTLTASQTTPWPGADVKADAVVAAYGQNATLAIAEEQALLRAAMAAREAGKHGLVIVRRRDAWHMRTNSFSTCGVFVGGGWAGVLASGLASAVTSAKS